MIPSEITIKGDLDGKISMQFKAGRSFNDYCAQHIPNYDRERFEALAIRFFYGNEIVVTVYAADKTKMEGSNLDPHKLPVKKFKMGFDFLKDILSVVGECNFTLTNGNYPLEDMEVMNR